MRTERAFVPKREIADEFRRFGSTMRREHPQNDTRKRGLERDLVPDLLPQILGRTPLAQQLIPAVHCATSPAANRSCSSREYILDPRSEPPTLSCSDADWV